MALDWLKNLTSHTSSDIVIIVMGPTGSGKSSFINFLLKFAKIKVGNNLKSCTKDIVSEKTTFDTIPVLKGYNFMVVDTPGFDDTHEDDLVILQRISEWLEKMYAQRTTLDGVIYLHDLSNNRFTGTLRRLEMINHLIEESALKSVLTGVTHLDRGTDEELATRMHQMKTEYWRSMIDAGSLVAELKHTHESAVVLIQELMSIIAHDTVVQIQREIVEEKKIIPETEAGKHLRYTLQEVTEAKEDGCIR